MGSGGSDEPGIHSDAMATHAAAGLEHVDPWVVVGKPDELTHVDVEVIAHQGELVGQGDVHVAETVLGELHQFSGAGCGGHWFALAKAGVKPCQLEPRRGDATDHAIVP